MIYSISYRSGVDRDLERLPAEVLRRVDRAIMGLNNTPRPSGCRKLGGAKGLWRVRVGDWRVVYEIDDAPGVVDIMLVAHRREVYRRL